MSEFHHDDSVHRALRPGDRGEDWRKVARAINRRFKDAGLRRRIWHTRGPLTKRKLRRAHEALELIGVNVKHPERLTKVAQARLRDPDKRTKAQKRRAKRRQRGSVHTPMRHILASSWGYHPGVHDGVDLICPPNEKLLAICDATVVRADKDGWWGLGAPASYAVRSKGDGIIILRCETNIGPFRRGMHFCYGHAEKPKVKVGQRVKAGQVIGRAGLANAWHSHFMVNAGRDLRGVGDRDPMPYVRFAIEHS